jgi:hypothetical protein
MRQKVRVLGIGGVLLLSLGLLASVALAGVFDHYPYQYWAPYQGYFIANEEGGTRYSFNDMNWGPRSGYFFRLGSSYKNGYEHENWFYNYCDAYGGCAYSLSAWTWGSNLPPVTDLDNNYSNPSGEVNLEIMTLDGDRIQTWSWYYADFWLNPNSSWSRAKVRGVRTYSTYDCGHWYCGFELDGVIIVPYNNYVAPGPQIIWATD